MNKRVEELAHQSGLDSFYVPEWSPWAEEFEKFAELIVQECINVIGESPHARETAMYYRKRLADHFGVNNASPTTSA